MAEAALAAEGRVSVKVDRMAAGSSRTSRRIDSLDMFLLYAMSRAPLPRAKLLRGSEQVEWGHVLLDRRRDTIYNPPVRVTHHRRQVFIEPGAALDHLRLRPHITGTRGHKPPLAVRRSAYRTLQAHRRSAPFCHFPDPATRPRMKNRAPNKYSNSIGIVAISAPVMTSGSFTWNWP